MRTLESYIRAMKSLLLYWFTFERPVSRATYVRNTFIAQNSE
jgi:hypothetical protein